MVYSNRGGWKKILRSSKGMRFFDPVFSSIIRVVLWSFDSLAHPKDNHAFLIPGPLHEALRCPARVVPPSWCSFVVLLLLVTVLVMRPMFDPKLPPMRHFGHLPHQQKCVSNVFVRCALKPLRVAVHYVAYEVHESQHVFLQNLCARRRGLQRHDGNG